MENQLLSGICLLLYSPNAVQSKCNSSLIKHCFIHKLYNVKTALALLEKAVWARFVVNEFSSDLLVFCTAPVRESTWRRLLPRDIALR